MNDFLVDINPNIELPKYELELHKLTEEPIMPLKNITNLQYKAFFVGIDELEFNIPLYRTESNGDKVKNEIYDLVDGEYLILLNQMKYFIITKIDEKSDDSGKVWKEVLCYSREYSLSHKKLVDYKANSRLLYDDTNSMLDGLEKGILNYIFNHVTKSWRIGYVDPDVILREGNGIYRSLDFPNTNLLQVFQELQKIYNCIFKFNTLERTMDIYSIDKKMGQHRGLYISDYNFLKSLSKEINYDEVKTRLFLYGKDNISIQSISPTGQPYIDNFNAYKNTKFMTQGLIDALNIYEEKVNNYNPDFEPLLQELQEANIVLEELYNADHIDDLNQKGLIALQRKLSEIQTMIDVKVEQLAIIMSSINNSDGTNLSDLYNDMKNVQTSIDALTVEEENINQLIINKETEISNQQKVIDGIKQQLHNLQYVLDVNNPDNFTEEQLKELDEFVRIETFNDSSYTENNITELYEEGVKLLNKISQPKIQFNTDVIDFLNVIECQHIWDKFVLGDIVTLEHNELGFNYDVRLVGYEHNIDSNSLNLKFSNTNTFDDANLYLSDLLEDFNATSTAVDFNKYKWDKPDYLESRIAKMVDTKLEEARQNILNAVGQKYLFDDNGLWLYKENPDGTLNPEQIRAINNTIALTEDNWNTVGTAITPRGIVGEKIYGKLGEFAQVTAGQVRTGLLSSEDGSTWIDLDNGSFNFKNALKWVDEALIIDSPDIPNKDDIVLQDVPYNNIKISANKGIEVIDNYSRQRVQLGNYTFGKYGLLLKDSSGTKTILDEDGMLQSWQEGKVGNVDKHSPLILNIYVPENTRYISKALLRFKMECFRAYSKSAISTEESTISSQSSVENTISSQNSAEISTTSAAGGGGIKTTHGGVDVEWIYPETQPAGDPPHTHTYKRVQAHAHDIILEDHTHTIKIPPHAHEIKIPPHEHEIIIPPHEHDIEYGIFEGDMPSNITITINGTDYTRYLGGRDGFNEDRDDLDITTLLEKGTWNTIEIGSSTMGRIDASVFIQCFMNTIRNSVILDETYLKAFKIRTGMGLGEVSVAPRKTQLHSNPDMIFEAHIIRGVIEATTKEWRTLDIEGWAQQFTIRGAKSVAVAFDGNWAKDEMGKYQFLTDDKPCIFWVNEEGKLFVRLWEQENTTKELARDVVKVKALRGWKNFSVSKNDYGLIAAYIKADGKVYYRNYCNQGDSVFMWEDERQIEEFTGTAKDISLFNTNDYRTGLMIEDSNGKMHWLITKRNWAGMAIAPERITAKINMNVDFIETTKYSGYCDEKIFSKPNIVLDFLYASNFNEFTHIENIDDGTGNFGIKVKIKTKYGLYNCLSSEFKLTDSDGVSFNCEDIENISPNELVLTFMDFNNAVGEVKLSYVRTSGTNEAGYAFDNFEGTFIPTGLIPTAIPVPEVEVIWNE